MKKHKIYLNPQLYAFPLLECVRPVNFGFACSESVVRNEEKIVLKSQWYGRTASRLLPQLALTNTKQESLESVLVVLRLVFEWFESNVLLTQYYCLVSQSSVF